MSHETSTPNTATVVAMVETNISAQMEQIERARKCDLPGLLMGSRIEIGKTIEKAWPTLLAVLRAYQQSQNTRIEK